MEWATEYIEALKRGETVAFRPKGQSMSGKIESGNLCTVKPLGDHELKVNDIVLCKVRNKQYLHLIKGIRKDYSLYHIGNNRGGFNGWVERDAIFGVLVAVSP